MLLVGLGDEALSQILSLASLDVAALWCAGDLALNNRIVRCCRSVRTEPRLASSTLKRWPRMLSSLRSLDELVLDVQSISEPIGDVKLQVQALAQSIKHIELRFELASILLLAQTENLKADPEAPVHGEPIEIDADHASCWDLKSYFPSLQSASFIDKPPRGHLHNSFKWSLSTASFNVFPPTLTSLHCSAVLADHTSLKGLPSSLTSLEFGRLGFEFLPPSDMEYPPHLTHLNGVLLRNEADVAKLPRSLVSGQWLWMPRYYEDPLRLDPGVIHSLPPNIATLRCYFFIDRSFFPANTAWTSQLPRRLTTLQLPHVTFTTEEFAALPTTLTTIEGAVETIEDFFENASSVLPSSVTNVTVSANGINQPKLPNSDRLVFPAHWRELRVSGASFPAAVIGRLPRQLRCLRLITTSVQKNNYSSFLAALPPNLETLDLTGLPLDALLRLPLSITSLGIYSGGITSPYIEPHKLPRGLLKFLDYSKQIEYTNDGATPTGHSLWTHDYV